MKLGRGTLLLLMAPCVASFAPISQQTTTPCRAVVTSLKAAHQHKDSTATKSTSLTSFVSGLVLAGTILASSFLVAPPEPSFAASTYEISTGAVVINTSTKPGQSLLKAEVDAKDLIGSVFKNRKALKQSVERISTVVKQELSGPAWAEIVRELLQTEKDVTPDIQVNPPNDVAQLAKDLSQGRLNLIVNGELINLSIDEKSTTETDELVIRAKGIKGVKVTQAIAKTRLEEQLEALDDFWNGEFTLVKLPESVGKVTNGLVFGGGTLSIIVASYALSYAYYVQQQEQASKEAEEKRQTMAAKAAAAKKAKAAKGEGEEE